MSQIQIFTNQTSSAYSADFFIKPPIEFRHPNSQNLLGIYYSVLGTPSIELQWKAPDGNWYDSFEPLLLTARNIILPINFNYEINLRIAYTAGGGSSLNAVLFY